MKSLDKIIREALSANKCKIGTRDVLKSLKGSKLIILTRSVPSTIKSKIVSEASAASIPYIYITYDGSSISFGRKCNKPFRVSAISLKIGDIDDIQSILNANQSK
jgi:large subunit ribosomal protein L30e